MQRSMIISLFAMTILFTPGRSAMAIEEPDFDVLAESESYEVRRYEPYLVAEVDVVGDGSDGRAFRVLAGYIFGGNEGREKMQMTAPVESRDKSLDDEEATTYAFVMERKYTLDTLPQPEDKRIRLLERSGRVVAVRRYSGGWSESKFAENRRVLLDALIRDKITVTGDAELARYDSPFKPWFLRRNEVLIPIVWSEVVSCQDDE
ncbi:MAG: heme-binding protein [Woeseiaceae bacterium]|nr:heme-binding protein [Woeseiaceae bacterium]